MEPQYNNAHIFTLDHSLLHIKRLHIKIEIPYSTFSFISAVKRYKLKLRKHKKAKKDWEMTKKCMA